MVVRRPLATLIGTGFSLYPVSSCQGLDSGMEESRQQPSSSAEILQVTMQVYQYSAHQHMELGNMVGWLMPGPETGYCLPSFQVAVRQTHMHLVWPLGFHPATQQHMLNHLLQNGHAAADSAWVWYYSPLGLIKTGSAIAASCCFHL